VYERVHHLAAVCMKEFTTWQICMKEFTTWKMWFSIIIVNF